MMGIRSVQIIHQRRPHWSKPPRQILALHQPSKHHYRTAQGLLVLEFLRRFIKRTLIFAFSDPVFFQAVYDDNLETEPLDALTNTQHLPILEDHIINQRMSSSPVSVRRVKRSMTMGLSSLTSITEPTASNRKAKALRPLKDLADLTQISTPKETADNADVDVWEFPSSNASDQVSKGKSRNAVKNYTMKTYGRLKRSKTMLDVGSSQSEVFHPRKLIEQEPLPTPDRKHTIQSREDEEEPMIPSAKRHRRGTSVNEAQFREVQKAGINGNKKVPL
jgi:hypothetical protein